VKEQTIELKQHWELVYETNTPDAVSWYAPHLGESLKYIKSTGLDPQKADVIDVGGGEATLVDDLLDAGYRGGSVLDSTPQTKREARTKGLVQIGKHA
jgi:hypothetical protein